MTGRSGTGPGKRTPRPAASARPGSRPSARAGRSSATSSASGASGAAGRKRAPNTSVASKGGTAQSAKSATDTGRSNVRLLPSWMSTSSVRSRRILMLATVFVMLAVILFPTLRAYVAQQNQISALRDEVAKQQTDVATLEKEQARWKDDAYVVQQARERLKFVKVGETSFTVIDGDPAVTTDPNLASAPGSANHPWYGRLWTSLSVADAATP